MAPLVKVEYFEGLGRGLTYIGDKVLPKGSDIIVEPAYCSAKGNVWALLVQMCEKLSDPETKAETEEIVANLSMVVDSLEIWSEEDKRMCKLIQMRYLQVNVLELYEKLACNNFQSIRYIEAMDGSLQKEQVAALYPVMSLLNHSCNFNVRVESAGVSGNPGLFVVRANRDIAPGEQLFANYVAKYNSTNQPTEFDFYTLSNWGFLCNCELCTKRRTK